LLSLKESEAEFTSDILYLSALSFYRRGKLSLGKAAELARLDKIDFIRKIQKEIAIFDYSDDEINEVFSDVDKIRIK
jgi:predicted HTH domain antitoxin